jgi:hypothetical protein
MLNLLKVAITEAIGPLIPSKTIKFYSFDGPTLLCEVPFDDLEIYTDGDRVGYKFKYADGTKVLRGSVLASGTVAYFDIDGVVPAEDLIPAELVTDMIHGTVGGLSTTADIRFNSLSWTGDVNISLSNLAILMLQGA